MGSVYKRGQKLWIRFKGPDGKWTQSKTDYMVGQERLARKLLTKVEDKIAAGAELGEADQGPLTVARYAERWIEERRKLGLEDWASDESRLRHHILPVLGPMQLDQMRPRHVVELVKKLRMTGKLAPKTIYNIYGVVKALFRDAHLGDLIEASPCILTKYQLGENTDKDPEWRATAVYTRDELERLISDPRIPWDRQVLYGLEGIAALRHGEAAGLRWKHYEPTLHPLGRLVIATSYNKGKTKTKRTRIMPVHPTLAAMLAEWKLRGWPEMMGRQPTPEDLVVPMPRGPKTPLGKMRSKNDSYKRLCTDLETLGLRHRRGHDLRRTMISLARTDGARKDLLELCTHNPGKKQSTIDIYTEFPWEALCGEVAKLKVKQLERLGEVVVLPLAMAAGAEGAEGRAAGPLVATRAGLLRLVTPGRKLHEEEPGGAEAGEAADTCDTPGTADETDPAEAAEPPDGPTDTIGQPGPQAAEQPMQGPTRVEPLATCLATSGEKGLVEQGVTWWRRRESNPGPQGVQLTFVHVRSRRDAGDGVRGFGRDLSLTNLSCAIEGTLTQPSPVVSTLGVPGRSPLWMSQRFLGRESVGVVVRTYNVPLDMAEQEPPHADEPSVPTSKPIAPVVSPKGQAQSDAMSGFCQPSYSGRAADGQGNGPGGVAALMRPAQAARKRITGALGAAGMIERARGGAAGAASSEAGADPSADAETDAAAAAATDPAAAAATPPAPATPPSAVTPAASGVGASSPSSICSVSPYVAPRISFPWRSCLMSQAIDCFIDTCIRGLT